jgi:hypothetical protein
MLYHDFGRLMKLVAEILYFFTRGLIMRSLEIDAKPKNDEWPEY